MANKEIKECPSCKKRNADDFTADIEYMDSEFSLMVSSKSVKHSKQIFNELFNKVKSAKSPKKNNYVG